MYHFSPPYNLTPRFVDHVHRGQVQIPNGARTVAVRLDGEDPKANAYYSANLRQEAARAFGSMNNPTIRIGTSAFTAAGWSGTFYPKNLKPADYLPYYAHHFDAVEIDSTFYGAPRI